MSVSEEIYVGPMIRIKKSKDFHEYSFCYDTLKEALFSPAIEKDEYCYLLPNQEAYCDEASEFDDNHIVIISNPLQSCKNFSLRTRALRQLIPVDYEVIYGVLRYYM